MDRLESILESLLFAATAPLDLTTLVEVTDESKSNIIDALAVLRARYEHRGVQLHKEDAGYIIEVQPSNLRWVERLVEVLESTHGEHISEAEWQGNITLDSINPLVEEDQQTPTGIDITNGISLAEIKERASRIDEFQRAPTLGHDAVNRKKAEQAAEAAAKAAAAKAAEAAAAEAAAVAAEAVKAAAEAAKAELEAAEVKAKAREATSEGTAPEATQTARAGGGEAGGGEAGVAEAGGSPKEAAQTQHAGPRLPKLSSPEDKEEASVDDLRSAVDRAIARANELLHRVKTNKP
jgi:hypothetical protein